MADAINEAALDQIFTGARTHNKWTDTPVSDDVLRRLTQIALMGPTAFNSLPMRVVFVKSTGAKRRLEPFLAEANREKTMAAPVCAIIGHDLKFYERFNKTLPHFPAVRGTFEGNEALIQSTAFRNSSLQGAYFIIAARALGLDTGPMSGFDNAGVDGEFFPEGDVRSNFLCALGCGDASVLHPRSPRLDFDEMAKII